MGDDATGPGEHLAAYAGAWIAGDGEAIAAATEPGYVLDDPRYGRIERDGMPAYIERLRDDLRALGHEGPFIELSEVVTTERDGGLVAWCWWEYPGTGISGAGLIHVGPGGVRSERLAYHSTPAEV